MTRLSQQFNELLKEEPPPRLHQINEEKLLAMGVSEDLANKYLIHPAFTPRHDTILVGSLAMMEDARGREDFIEYALSAEDEVDANLFQNMAEILRGYHQSISPIKRMTVMRPFVLAEAANGSVPIPLPIDHGLWTETPQRRVKNVVQVLRDSGSKGKLELWVTGTVSALARQQLGLLGIEVMENVDERIELAD